MFPPGPNPHAVGKPQKKFFLEATTKRGRGVKGLATKKTIKNTFFLNFFFILFPI